MSFVLFLLTSLYKSSFVSDEFDFNASLNDFAPVSLMQSPVDFEENERREDC